MTNGVPKFVARLLELGEDGGVQERNAGSGGFDPAAGRRTGPSPVVSSGTVRGIPAYGLAARIAAEGVARLRLGVWTGEGTDRRRVTDDWRARLFRGAPNPDQTRFEFWEAVEESLTYRGNAYIWKVKDTRVREMWVLHPDQVSPQVDADGRVTYRVMLDGHYVNPLGRGRATVVVDRGTVLHIKGHGGGGRLIAPSPVQLYRRALAAAISKEVHEERLYARSATLPFGIEMPAGVPPETVRKFKAMWRADYEGAEQSGGVPVIGGGGAFRSLGLSQADAQFVEAMNFSVEEVARITNVQASLLGVNRSSRPLTPEHEEDRWHRFGIGPRLERIESAVEADPDLFGPGARLYPMFDAHEAVRGDLITEERLAHQQVQDGRLLVDEWRARKGMPPLPGGVGSIPQIVPVGGAPNPVTTSPAVDVSDDEED